MTVQTDNFKKAIALCVNQFRLYQGLKSELDAIAQALDADTTVGDATVATPPLEIRIGSDKTAFQNEVLHIVNKGRAVGISGPDMADALSSLSGEVIVPTVVDVPHVSGGTTVGSELTCTKGNWTGSPTEYAYAWKRDGATAIGTNAATYTLVAADLPGHAITCIVTATNAQGSTIAPPSNAIAT